MRRVSYSPASLYVKRYDELGVLPNATTEEIRLKCPHQLVNARKKLRFAMTSSGVNLLGSKPF